jgi:D-alanyl-D-alanine carboxypeptidase
MPGVSTLNAVIPDGHRSAVFYVATALADPDRGPALMRRELTLLDDLSCGTR